jgi:cytoskeletal protein CcmA (bactofilin family)
MIGSKEKGSSDQPTGSGLNLIGRGTSITGTIRSSSSVRIEGEIKGQVQCQDLVTLGSTGTVEGDIQAKNVVIGGKVVGNMVVQEKLVLEPKCHVQGDIKARRLVIDEGATFEGNCSMKDTNLVISETLKKDAANS